jgi:hypothetical protein
MPELYCPPLHSAIVQAIELLNNVVKGDFR